MLKNKYNRIFITGASGTGKTTMAQWISENYNIPFISTSAKKLWPRFNFNDHRDAIRCSILNPSMGIAYQHAILHDRLSAINQTPEGFVTDRSPFDNYTHILLQGGFMYTSELLSDLARGCKQGFKPGDLVIFLRVTPHMDIEDDGKRVNIKDYQLLIDSTIQMVITKELVKSEGVRVIQINTWDYKFRRKILKEIL